ncbi:hypothetical protein [Mesorhizobium sp. NFR06]|uniref:hypothetical protein n=1 Tax=Mesorhizobium sp. NFR06 TaxID=1566290 RepID=UPI00122D7C90|nr:hypothetical protein [Mesorhizobium sp. NFR06]
MGVVLVDRTGRVGRQSDIRMGREMIAGSWMIRCRRRGGSSIERGWRQVALCLVRQGIEHVGRHWE